ncbi:MAG TPA: hypothetical protein VGQ76_17205 [Thermoanaerobaculia bacterium]|nr:hypothetical protein [Thermoanaerobaculia bacterium]
MKRTLLVALALLLPAVVRAQQPQLTYSTQPGGVVAATLPLSILQDANVRKQLRSGLTTTFLLVARHRDTKVVSGARLEVRYDLWDEVWIVQKIELDRKGERQRLTSLDALEKWWRVPLRMLSTKASRVAFQVDLSVLPFSAAEEEDARQWITKSGGVGTGGNTGGLVDALIGTTISAKPLTSYRWNVELALQ